MLYKHALGYGSILVAGFLALAFASSAAAFHSPEHYSLFGDAEYVSPGHNSDRAVLLTSDSASSTAWGGIEFGVTASTTYADLTTLSTEYMLASGDMCGGGSPRFQIAVEDPSTGDSGNIFVYLGDAPNYTCTGGTWLSSGDLLGSGTVDTSQLDGGTFYDPYASSTEKYGDYIVTDISLVADAGWSSTASGGDGVQAVTVDNTVINSTTFTYEEPAPTTPGDKNACKDGGWMSMTDTDGNAFKNQGQCVSFIERNK
jgi:hypothetical protein